MAPPNKPRPIPDALMFRDVQPGIWDVRRVPEHRVGAYLEGGWIVLITEAQMKAADIEDAYRSDLKERR